MEKLNPAERFENYEYPEYTFDHKYDNDSFQREVIALDEGYHLVLAPPGCGKTDILAERIIRARSRKVDFGEMLCLTFTNRAARNMRTRIAQRLEHDDPRELFVGNVHRFCSHFLFDAGVIGKSAAVIDETDEFSVLSSLEGGVAERNEFQTRELYSDIAAMQHLMVQMKHGHPEEIFMHGEVYAKYPFGKLWKYYGEEAAGRGLDVIYEVLEEIDVRYAPEEVRDAYRILSLAKGYEAFKVQYDMYDFDDLLIMTYDYAVAHSEEVRKYSWIQIDEVQDLSPIQFAIVDCFTEKEKGQVTLYLGDEQQAIFSFIGAKISTLDWLRRRCGENTHRLYNNYRSPKYLLDIYNTYANMVLDVDPAFLPRTNNLTEPEKNALVIFGTHNKEDEVKKVAVMAKFLLDKHPEERTAVLVPWNSDAEAVSAALGEVPHFKISGNDLFMTPQAQLMFAHLQALQQDTNRFSWSRMLSICGKFPDLYKSRAYLQELGEDYVLLSDLMLYEDSSYFLEMEKCYGGDYVIYDTETTGLNVNEDDIVQIAAMKMHGCEVVEEFNVFLETSREIPKMLGEVVNPLTEEYAHAQRHSRAEGLRLFMDFIGDLPLVGHNVEYDYRILDANLKRDCGIDDLFEKHPVYFDTLKLSRIVAPRLRNHKLKFLLQVFNLEGENSHLANDDIMATKSVLDYFMAQFAERRDRHVAALAACRERLKDFIAGYAEVYKHGRARLFAGAEPDGQAGASAEACAPGQAGASAEACAPGQAGASAEAEPPVPALVEELRYAYSEFLNSDWIKDEPKVAYIFEFLKNDVVDVEKAPSFKEQLDAYLLDLTTFREADLCDDSSSTVKEKVFISTVHKAKGLEFENVILFEATDGVYPFFMAKTAEKKKESARLFYVGMSRAKRRLYPFYCRFKEGISKWGKPYSVATERTAFLDPVEKFFRIKETE